MRFFVIVAISIATAVAIPVGNIANCVNFLAHKPVQTAVGAAMLGTAAAVSACRAIFRPSKVSAKVSAKVGGHHVSIVDKKVYVDNKFVLEVAEIPRNVGFEPTRITIDGEMVYNLFPQAVTKAIFDGHELSVRDNIVYDNYKIVYRQLEIPQNVGLSHLGVEFDGKIVYRLLEGNI